MLRGRLGWRWPGDTIPHGPISPSPKPRYGVLFKKPRPSERTLAMLMIYPEFLKTYLVILKPR